MLRVRSRFRANVATGHEHELPVVVEARGSHPACDPDRPTAALDAGLVISSPPKVLGSLTQAVMLLLGHGGLIAVATAEVATTS